MQLGVFSTCNCVEDEGVMITVFDKGGTGYGATSNITKEL